MTKKKGQKSETTETTETPPDPEGERSAKEKFIQITGDSEAMYGLDSQGRVFVYVDDSKAGEHGWYQLEFDETRGTEEENIGKVERSPGTKFVQITGNADGLHAMDESGRVYFYDDDETGWFQLEYDDEPHQLAPPVED